MSASPSDRPTARYVMASDLQGKHILDTSAWNALFKDQRRDELLEILGTKVILPTTLSISELAATEDPEKRLALIRLVKTAGKIFVPSLSRTNS